MLETQLRKVLATCSGPVFEASLALLASELERDVQDSKGVLIPSLRALAVISSLSIPRESRQFVWSFTLIQLPLHRHWATIPSNVGTHSQWSQTAPTTAR